jgi:hypothetical protein
VNYPPVPNHALILYAMDLSKLIQEIGVFGFEVGVSSIINEFNPFNADPKNFTYVAEYSATIDKDHWKDGDRYHTSLTSTGNTPLGSMVAVIKLWNDGLADTYEVGQ